MRDTFYAITIVTLQCNDIVLGSHRVVALVLYTSVSVLNDSSCYVRNLHQAYKRDLSVVELMDE